MSVIVKGMKMPKPGHCNECDVWSFCWTEKPSYNMFKSTCPLVALPDKHGDLIARDGVLQSLIAWSVSGEVKSIEDIMDEQDTIVEAEDEP